MRGVYGAQSHPTAIQNRRFAQSPTDALIDLIVRCGLRRQIPVRLDLHNHSNGRLGAGRSKDRPSTLSRLLAHVTAYLNGRYCR